MKHYKELITTVLICGFVLAGFSQSTVITSLMPPYPSDATKYLDGTGQWTVPAGGAGGGVVGTVSNNVASAGLLAVDATKTNGIAATAAHVTTALGYTPLTNTATAITNALGYVPVNKAGDTGVGGVSLNNIVVTNAAISTIPVQVNALAGTTNNLWEVNGGGTNFVKVNSLGQLLLSDGTAAAPSWGWLADADGAGTGMYREGADRIGIACNGVLAARFNAASGGGNLWIGAGSIIWGTSASSIDAVMTRDAANTIQQGGDAATATAQTIKAHDGSGTDKDGAGYTFEGGQNTGTGRGGNVILRTANTAGASSSTAGTYSERFHAPAKFVNLTDATATTLFTIPVAATNYVGLTAVVTIYATDGTDHQSKTSRLIIDAIAKTTTITATVTETANTTAASSGTLTCTYTVVDAGSNVLAVKAAASSSLTETVLRAKVVITAINSNGTAAITEQ